MGKYSVPESIRKLKRNVIIVYSRLHLPDTQKVIPGLSQITVQPNRIDKYCFSNFLPRILGLIRI